MTSQQGRHKQTQRRRRLLDERQDLINRYVRLAVRQWLKRKLFAIARFWARPRLYWSDRARHRALVGALETLAIEVARARRLGFEGNETVLNLGLYFLIAERDIQAVKLDALTHSDPWVRGLAARVMLLTVHELDLDKAAGNRLRKALDDGAVPTALRDEVNDAMRTIRKAQGLAQKQFASLRNSTIAHRDANALKQYADIVAVDGMEIANIVADFYSGTRKFIAVMPRLLLHLSTMTGLLSQMEAQRARAQVDQVPDAS